nr:MAG TPA: baseplate component [Caudoviricetes sp.]
MRLSELYGNDITERDKLKSDIMFNMRCCIPCIVQSFDYKTGTVECQPAIREKIINQNEEIEYKNIPLLINVPVVFPSNSEYSITFPLKKGDECLVLFSDLSIDNFWEKGNVQNPIEDRRHDLSDGIAIPCNLSLVKQPGTNVSGLTLKSTGSSIVLGSSDITFKNQNHSVTLSQLLSHIHTVPGGVSGPPQF